ncbi:MAG: zinc ABC transporter substrate-binding protein, partial [Alphaproteobacteria bacterium]
MRKKASNGAMILLACATFAFARHAAATPEVVATIAPIHSLVAGVMAGAGAPTLLLPPNASPHSYALKPSDANALSNADIVFWIGEELETFMERPLRALAADARIVGLAGAPGMILLPVRAAGSFEDRDRQEHEHASHDPHIWLSPVNAQRIVDIAVTTLADMDAANTAIYRRNGDQLRQQIQDLSARITVQLSPLQSQPYIVFHDAYQYFEHGFDL